jgi:hypothetical protein
MSLKVLSFPVMNPDGRYDLSREDVLRGLREITAEAR